MADIKPATMTMTHSDMVGATLRGLDEIAGYLRSNPTQVIHGPAVVAEMERLMGFMSHIPAPKVAEDKKAA